MQYPLNKQAILLKKKTHTHTTKGGKIAGESF